ncbi:MAG: hypothetical protein F6K11_23060, partial [Leptolyngbya sp. SIO3F4]|nr:hypothetical protein [Leptolyngbya sp. SIO3F4]
MTYASQDFSDFSMLDIFRMEVETQIALLNDNLLAVESQTELNSDFAASKLEALMRAAHSIKGAARIVGLDLAVKVAHVMEDCFVAAQSGKLRLGPHNIDTLLEGVDWYDQLKQVQEADLSSWLEQQTEVTLQLVAKIAALLTPSTANQSATSIPADLTTTSDSLLNQDTPVAADKPLSSELTIPLQTNDQGSADVVGIETVETDEKTAQTSVHRTDQPINTVAPHSGHTSNGDASSRLPTDNASASTDISIGTNGTQKIASDRVVRVSVDNLNRLMALAGESLVEVNWFQPFADAMLHLKHQQQDLARVLAGLQHESNLSLSAEKPSELQS